MLVKVKCPDCEGTHYVDIAISGLAKRKFKSEDDWFQYIIDNITARGIFPEEAILENL